MRKKKKITPKERSLILHYLASGYPRTRVAKQLKMKISTLERVCEEEKIPLTPKYKRIFVTNKNYSGRVKTKYGVFNFSCENELFSLIFFEKNPVIKNIVLCSGFSFRVLYENENFTDIGFDDNKINDSVENAKWFSEKSKFLTIDMIKNLVESKRIRFHQDYFNKKFGIDYDVK
jgi:hypothetical protein